MSEDRSNRNRIALDHSDLELYKIAFQSAMNIFHLSKKWPTEERYSLTDQIRRSSRSVCGNVAEAWRKRRYTAHFVSKLSDSDAEATETIVWLEFARECGYLNEIEYEELFDKYDHICRMLTNMIKSADKWCKNF
jgi:four helix bundle protein